MNNGKITKMMVLSPSKQSNATSEIKKRFSTTTADDSNCIPLPIQSFLWRQTNPFLGSKVGKLHEASCVTFERVVVQNILHGLSPSLSDAIASIPRWRFVRAAFPHVVQCCSALLNERQRNEDEGRLSQSLSKMLYILHWMVFDSASECADSDSGGGVSDDALNQYLFPLNCIQIFVYLVAPLVHTLKENDIINNRRLEAGVSLWQSLWENRQPEILCFAAPVKPKKSQLMCVPLLKRTLQQTTAGQDIYMGGGIYLGDEESPKRTRQRSMAQISPLKPPDMLQLEKSKPQSKSASKAVETRIPASTFTVPSISTTVISSMSGNVASLTSISESQQEIKPPQRSVSAYHKKYSEPSKATIPAISGLGESSVTYENLARTGDSDGVLKLDELAQHLKYVEEGSSGGMDISDRAPLVQLRDICGPAWPSLDLPSSPSMHCDVMCEVCQTMIYRDGTFLGACQCGKGVQQLRIVSSSSAVSSSSMEDGSSLGSISAIGQPPPPAVPLTEPPRSPSGSATLYSQTQTTLKNDSPSKIQSTEEGTGLDATPISTTTTMVSFSRKDKPHLYKAAASVTLSEKPSSGTPDGGTPVTQVFGATSSHASYMDVAVLRCLSIRHWPEEGVYWGLRYIYQRLLDVTLENAQKTFCRKRSSSVPLPKLKVTFATLSTPQGQSKTDLDLVDAETKRPPTWEHLKPESDTGKLKRKSSSKSKVAFFVEDETRRTSDGGKKEDALSVPKDGSGLERRRSMNSIKQMFAAKLADRATEEGKMPLRQRESSVSATGGTRFNAGGPIGSVGSLARSATDSNISYITEFLTEAVGSSPYIHKNGQLNLKVVLQVVANVAERHLSLRVCETILNVLDIMLDADMFARLKRPTLSPATSNASPPSVGKATQDTAASAGDSMSLTSKATKSATDKAKKDLGPTKSKEMTDGDKTETSGLELTDLVINALTRILFVLGCQHGCSDGVRSPQADFLRSQCRNCLSRLFRHDKFRFVQCVKDFVTTAELSRIVDFFHAFTGFCYDMTAGSTRLRSASRSSQDPNKPRTEPQQMPNYKNKFLISQKGIEGIIMMASLKLFVSRLETSFEELKQPENTGLHQDVRAFMTFVQENHGHAFRIVELSALIDATQKQPKPATTELSAPQTESITDSGEPEQEAPKKEGTKKKAEKPQSLTLPAITVFDTGVEKSSGSANESDSEGSRNASPSYNATKEQAAGKKRFFKRQKDKLDESDADSSSPGTPRHRLSTEETPTGSSSSPLLPGMIGGKKKTSKLQMALSILKSVRSENHGSGVGFDETDASDTEADRSQEDLTSEGGDGTKKLKRKISFKSAARSLSIISKVRKKKLADGSLDESGDGKEKTKLVIEQLQIPSKNYVSILAIREGARRFAFMLETCKPGSVPDAPLLGALLDLNAPVLARAMIFIECCHFVHRCNKGQWPEWIRAVPIGRASGAPLGRGAPSGLRRANLLQRAAGKLFYHWGEAVAVRLEEIMQREKVNADSMVRLPFDELTRQQLRVNDDLEDFLDEAIVNPNGEECPFALKLLACMLLYEITAFMRETFQSLPRSRSQSRLPSNWDKLMSHRRWSVLSATFNPSQQSGSIQSIADLVTILHPSIGERRISFCAQEDEESLHSSHSTIDEGNVTGDKRSVSSPGAAKDYSCLASSPTTAISPKNSRSSTTTIAIVEPARRLAQGRQRLLKRGGGGSQRARRSIRYKRSKEKRDDEETPSGVAPSSTIFSVSELRRKSLRLMRSLTSGSSVDHQATGADAGDMAHRGSLKSRKQSALSDEVSGAEIDESPERISDVEVQQQGFRHASDSPADAASAATQQSDQEDASYCKHLPWLKTVVHLGNMFNFVCTHQKYCHPFCYHRCYRQCYRMMIALRKVYGEMFPLEGQLDKRRALLDTLCQKERDRTMDERRRVSALNTIRRESAMVRGGAVDKGSAMHLKSLLMERLDTDEGKEKDKEIKSKDKRLPDVEKLPETRKPVVDSPILKYIKAQVFNPTHSPLSTFLKAALVASETYFLDILPVAWELLLESDVNVVASAAAAFITCSVKQAEHAVDIMRSQLAHKDPSVRICAVTRFYTLWRHRYHCWLMLEEGAHVSFKVPPPGIDFTLPSPPVGLPQVVVVDPPWMPHKKAKIQELTLKEEEDTTKQTIMTMTKTRRKQKQEILKRAIQQAEERKSSERRQHFFLATPVQQQAAYEPALFATTGKEAPAAAGAGTVEDEEPESHPVKVQVPVAQPLFPSCLCIAAPLLVEMLDDSEVNPDGMAVSEVARKVVWSCIVEDCALFIRHFLEKLTSKDKQEELLGLLRKLLLHFGALPPQTAYTLVNYLIGFVMYYTRTPCEGSQEAIGIALSLMWMVVPHLQGLYFKDAKQTLRKEQCDAAILITANVPSAKKIIVHGPDQTSIPSQFPVHEDTQFQQIYSDSVEFFNVPEDQAASHFLVDSKTGLMHNLGAYVRDFYFFHRSQYPQLNLVALQPNEALPKLKQMARILKFMEVGKVLFSYSILKHSPEGIVPQRIYFLHEELTHLSAFPRKALEACFGLYNGLWGKELHGVDVLHKLSWAQLVTSMLRGMENPYLFGDLHLFINVINGILILHAEDSAILRHCMATYIEIAFRFKTMFSTSGFFLIMPTILRCYSNYQTNFLLCDVIEFTCKQFYIMHRKPFILQTFGAIANILDTCDNEQIFDPMLVKSVHLFQLLCAMQNLDNLRDTLEILSLVHAEKPLKALDLCYRDDPLAFCVLTDAFASCVTICAYSPESRRSYQMLLIIQAILPHYLRRLQDDTKKAGNSPAALKHEMHCLMTLIVEMKALIGCCDILARAFSGPQKSFDIVSMGGRGRSMVCESPQVFEPGEESIVVRAEPTKKSAVAATAAAWEANDDTELQREVFRRPRDALLVLAAIFLKNVTSRVRDLGKSVADHGKIPEVLDQKYHMKLSEVAHSLLKLAPYDPNTLSCEGLQRYFLDILPVTDWAVEQNRSALNLILRRLDKTFSKIVKRNSVRRRINWDALSNWLIGLYQTLQNFPYMAHLHFLKTTVQVCLKIIIGDPVALGGADESSSSVAHSAPATVLTSFTLPQNFCSAVMKLTCILMQTLGEQSFPLEYVCSVETLGSLSERIEPILCHVITPLFLRVGTGAKDAPQLRRKDLSYSLNLMLNAVNPLTIKATLGPTTSLAAAIISRPPDSGRQGSVSVQDRQVTPSNAPKFIRESIYQSVFLALKVMCLSFEKKLNAEWVKIARVTKELGLKRTGGVAFWNFLEFALTVRTPLNVLLRPFVEHKLLLMKPQSDFEVQWHEIIREKLSSNNLLVGRSNGAWLMELALELKNLKEDLSNKPLEGVQSRTPTILADLHSDSSSMQSAGRRQSDPRRISADNRRLSASASSKVSRLSPSPLARQGLSPQESIQSPIEDTTIMEEAEIEGVQQVFVTTESDIVPTHFPRHKTTLRLSNRGSKRRPRRSFYRSRDDDASQLADLAECSSETFEMRPVAGSVDAPATSRPRLSLAQRTQSLDQPTTVRVTSEFGETTEFSIPKRQGAFRARSQSQSQSPLEALPSIMTLGSGQLREQRITSRTSSSGEVATSSKTQTKFV